MEFERAIYRVYERCLDGLREDQDEHGNASMKSCKFLELISFCFGVFLLFTLVFLHTKFVGSAGCLPNLLSVATAPLNNTYDADYPYLHADQILYINIDKRFQPEQALDEDNERTQGINVESASVLRGLSRLTKMVLPNTHSSRHLTSVPHPQHEYISLRGTHLLNTTTPTNTTVPSNTTQPGGGGDKSITYLEPSYDYKFTYNSGLLLLPYQELKEHQYVTVNVSLLGEACYGGSVSQSLIPLGGVDTVVVNALMNTLKQPGHVFTSAGDYFRWTDSDLQPYGNPLEWFQFKLLIVCYSLFAFFFLTTITALLVRILISSGVVLIFPIFWMLQLFGFAPLNLRIVAISYPWIGLPLEVIRSRNQSITPFILGHISRVVIYYFLYQATQLVFAVWFYNRDSPGQQELWIFGVMMLWEYYSMIYVRSVGSIQLFPRASLALFLVYHFYYFSFPSGFHVLALVTMFFFLLALMVHCIRVYEMKDYERGTISLDQPRALYNSLPWPVWNADLAPEFTLMMPLSHRAVSAYNANIPAVPGATFQAPQGAAGAVTAAVGGGGAGSGVGGAVVNPLQGNSNSVGGSASGSASNSPVRDVVGSSSDGVEMSGVLRAVPATTSTSTSASNSANNSSRGGVSYSRLNSSSAHGEDEERGAGDMV